MSADPIPAPISEELVRLIYVSSAVDLLSEAELTQILHASRRNNERAGITGMLLYYDGSFLQVLEGPASSVEATFNRIHSDPRHRGLIRMAKTSISQRDFGDWSMGFSLLNSRDLADVPGSNDFFLGAKCLDEVSEGTAKRLLTKFRSSAR